MALLAFIGGLTLTVLFLYWISTVEKPEVKEKRIQKETEEKQAALKNEYLEKETEKYIKIVLEAFKYKMEINKEEFLSTITPLFNLTSEEDIKQFEMKLWRLGVINIYPDKYVLAWNSLLPKYRFPNFLAFCKLKGRFDMGIRGESISFNSRLNLENGFCNVVFTLEMVNFMKQDSPSDFPYLDSTEFKITLKNRFVGFFGENLEQKELVIASEPTKILKDKELEEYEKIFEDLLNTNLASKDAKIFVGTSNNYTYQKM